MDDKAMVQIRVTRQYEEDVHVPQSGGVSNSVVAFFVCIAVASFLFFVLCVVAGTVMGLKDRQQQVISAPVSVPER